MKEVMISICPEWVEKILSGEKTIEVRKTAPKIKTPFKCYIYCTKARKPIIVHGAFVYWDDDLAIIHTPYGVEIRNPYGSLGKDDKLLNGKVVGEFICGKIIDEVSVEHLTPYGLKCTCLTKDELNAYLGNKDGYGWHISDLKIYDKPKEISEFKNLKGKPITRAFQSWGYVISEAE